MCSLMRASYVRETARTHHRVDLPRQRRAAGSRGVLGVGLLQTAAELLRVSERRRGDGDDGVADGALDGVAVAHALGAEREVLPVERVGVDDGLERVGECGAAGATHSGRVCRYRRRVCRYRRRLRGDSRRLGGWIGVGGVGGRVR